MPAAHAAGFSTHLAQRKTEFESDVVRLTFNLLRMANARHDRDVLRRVCVAWSKLADVVEADAIAAASALVGGDFVRAWCDYVEPVTGSEWLEDHVADVRRSLVERLNFLEFVDRFLVSLADVVGDDQLASSEAATWRELHGEILQEYGEDGTTLNLYLQEMDLRSKGPNAPPDAIRLLTVHGSKGLEFKHVFLMGMAEDVFPAFQAVKKGDQSHELEEERRSCFVAITRVQESLTLTNALAYYGYPKLPSRFLREMQQR